jgi:hypothetical protein
VARGGTGARLDAMAHAQAVLEGRAPMGPKRKPSYAALFSLVLPGLGQIYNGDLLKGVALMMGFVILLAISSIGIMSRARAVNLGGRYYTSPESVLSVLGTSMVWVGLLWCCGARRSAALRAQEGHRRRHRAGVRAEMGGVPELARLSEAQRRRSPCRSAAARCRSKMAIQARRVPGSSHQPRCDSRRDRVVALVGAGRHFCRMVAAAVSAGASTARGLRRV